MATATYGHIVVYCNPSDQDGLGLDTDLPGCESIDIEASCLEYDHQLNERLVAIYPGITIKDANSHGFSGMRVFDMTTDGNPEDSPVASEAFAVLSAHAEDLFNHGELWVRETS